MKTLIKHIYLDETIERLPTAQYEYNFKLRRIIKKHAAQKFHNIIGRVEKYYVAKQRDFLFIDVNVPDMYF